MIAVSWAARLCVCAQEQDMVKNAALAHTRMLKAPIPQAEQLDVAHKAVRGAGVWAAADAPDEGVLVCAVAV